MQYQAPDRTSIGSSESSLASLQPALLSTGAINGTPTATAGQWTQRATNSEINVYFVAGNTPSRSRVNYRTSVVGSPANTDVVTGETGGGLHNFVRFAENWTGVVAKITGGFIQNTRSVYATASFSATAPYANPTLVDTTGDIQTLFINPLNTTTAGQSLSNFRKYYQSVTTQALPFYAPPFRLWGFDVGLLTQSADRFAERFSSSIANPNEFFREVDRTDPYVKALLCAAQPASPSALNPVGSLINPGLAQKFGTIPTNYTDFVLGGTFATDNACPPLTYN